MKFKVFHYFYIHNIQIKQQINASDELQEESLGHMYQARKVSGHAFEY